MDLYDKSKIDLNIKIRDREISECDERRKIYEESSTDDFYDSIFSWMLETQSINMFSFQEAFDLRRSEALKIINDLSLSFNIDIKIIE